MAWTTSSTETSNWTKSSITYISFYARFDENDRGFDEGRFGSCEEIGWHEIDVVSTTWTVV